MPRHSRDKDREREPEREREREPIQRLTDGQMATLRTVGTFRMVDRKDLDDAYSLRLLQKGYVVRSDLRDPKAKGIKREIFTLSEKGQRHLEAQPEARGQRYWRGIVKPREVFHDLEILRAYRKEAVAIEDRGGHVQKVILDYEWKEKIAPVLSRRSSKPLAERREELAEEHQLPIVRDKLMYPDARIVFEDKDGHQHHLDLEVVTRTYRGAIMHDKRQSGFKMYKAGNDSGSARSPVRDDHHQRFL
jgi:hypothetical protein